MKMSHELFVKSSLCIYIGTDILGQLLRLLPFIIIVMIVFDEEGQNRMLHIPHPFPKKADTLQMDL